jgi:hypothetical protein
MSSKPSLIARRSEPTPSPKASRCGYSDQRRFAVELDQRDLELAIVADSAVLVVVADRELADLLDRDFPGVALAMVVRRSAVASASRRRHRKPPRSSSPLTLASDREAARP